MIHEHPVWIKMKPNQNRIGYYQEKRWIITDIVHLQTMLDVANTNPTKVYEYDFATSLNEVEEFTEAIWSD